MGMVWNPYKKVFLSNQAFPEMESTWPTDQELGFQTQTACIPFLEYLWPISFTRWCGCDWEGGALMNMCLASWVATARPDFLASGWNQTPKHCGVRHPLDFRSQNTKSRMMNELNPQLPKHPKNPKYQNKLSKNNKAYEQFSLLQYLWPILFTRSCGGVWEALPSWTCA